MRPRKSHCRNNALMTLPSKASGGRCKEPSARDGVCVICICSTSEHVTCSWCIKKGPSMGLAGNAFHLIVRGICSYCRAMPS
jgi:hypothetical protein